MNNRNNRATRAIVASGSLLAIIFIAIPWVDEYLRLRRDVAELNELELRFVATQRQNSQLHRIEDKLKAARKRGWGIQIIKGLMDEVEISSSDDGTRVVMRKVR